MLIAFFCTIKSSSMTDSMNFGPEWLRNLSSEGSTAGGAGGGTRYQLADYRYGREEMLALFEKGTKAPNSLSTFPPLYSEQFLPPLALLPVAEEERWQARAVPPGAVPRGRGGSLERGGRGGRGRAMYQTYGRGYDGSGSWNPNSEQTDWSARKDYLSRASSVDNWRRNRTGEDDEGWRSSNNHVRGPLEKWSRSTSWRDGGDGGEERGGPPERNNRTSWQEGTRGGHRRPWDGEDHLPEWAMENPSDLNGSFDASGAFHGSDEEQKEQKGIKREVPLQKSISQQSIGKTHPAILPSSQSALSLLKPPDDEEQNDKQANFVEEDHHSAEVSKNRVKLKEVAEVKKEPVEQICDKPNDVIHSNLNGNGIQDLSNKVEEEFDRMQEDIVKKLVVDEDMPKKMNMENFGIPPSAPTNLPPPNLPQIQDKWYYQDPQGDLQGAFLSSEMAEWFRAGYFTSSLLVKRLCDETFHRLGDLVNMCGGNPFQTNTRIPPLKHEIQAPPENDLMQYQLQYQRQLALNRQATMRVLNPESWANLPNMQQRELLAQQVLAHPQMAQDLQFLHQPTSQPPQANPLMQMINQMQQANKLPGQSLTDKSPAALQTQLDPIQALVQQMGGLSSIQNSSNVPILPTTVPSSVGLSGNTSLMNNFQNLPAGLPGSSLPVGLSIAGAIPNPSGLLVSGSGLSLPGNSVMSNSDTLSSSSGLPVNIQAGLPGSLSSTLPPRPNPLGAVDSSNENETIKNLLRQLASKQQNPQLDALWQQNQFANAAAAKQQWQTNSSEPMNMWDMRTSTITTTQADKSDQVKIQEKERQKQLKENQEKELKRKRELEEKQAKKEAEEKRKEEQRRQEAERKAMEEKRKKEEERIRKEIERVKKEADEKRIRELEEKRRLKEQRKAEEEARRKSEEQRKIEESEKARREAKEREEQLQKQMELARQEINIKASRVAPWCQANSTPELSLADIQKAEREKRAEQAALLQQHRAQQVLQEQPAILEKTNLQFNWAKKPPEPRKVKSLAEIQQEEQERLAKQAAEARLAQIKEKEIVVNMNPTQTIPWSGQNLTWASTAAQWNNAGGFWDEPVVQKSPNKSVPVTKSSSTTTVTVKQPIKQNKSKTKKEEQQILKLFNNGPTTDEFTDWCTEALGRITNTVDIPTFVSFLRDIESALEVRDYCREYLGDGNSTQQFATQFLEKRRIIKNKLTEKDDMSSPAPAITPSTQHSTEFQEVKGKGKKTKKSKMTKVDARILGFSVTSAPDRINIGDRDYVEN